MRITNNSLSDALVRQIQQLGSKQARLQTHVATGQKIFQPEDAPSTVGSVLGLESEQRYLAQFAMNADRALELSQATFAGLQQLKGVTDRATEIGTLGMGAISPDSARAYAAEMDQLLEQAVQLSNSRFRNDYLFAGTAVDAAPMQVTRDGSERITGATYVGNAERAHIPVSETASISPGTSSETNLGLRDLIEQLRAMRDGLDALDPTAIASAQQGLLASEDTIVSALAEHGGVQTRIEATRAQQTARSDNIESLISGEVDADLPETIVKLSQAQTAYQAALQSAANIMRVSLLDYIR